jgi:hypothetical protein
MKNLIAVKSEIFEAEQSREQDLRRSARKLAKKQKYTATP